MPQVKQKTLRQLRGTEGERTAEEYLVNLRYTILETNAHTHWGEIDIIAKSPDGVIVFVEVRTKRGLRWGTPEDSFNHWKQQKIRRAIDWYCLNNRIQEEAIRVDLIAIEHTTIGKALRHYKNVSLE